MQLGTRAKGAKSDLDEFVQFTSKVFNQILLFRTNDLCKTLHVFDICALATLQTFNTLTIIEAVLAFSPQLSVFLWHEYKTVEKILI